MGERYEIRALIGRGGMGEVFRAWDSRLQTDVAIKRIPPQFASSPELRESLTKEARLLARLSDGAIVRLFDLAEPSPGELYLILEYVPGPSLRDLLRERGRITPPEMAHIVGQLCQGLETAHRAGVIHRDLKPSNVLLGLSGGPDLLNARAKIADFGIAKAIADAQLTVTNAFAGTPGYMAPERTASPETDVYALGVLTYELLTGKLPSSPLPQIPGVPSG